ncbi:glycosyltransferase [Aliiglaciecola sp. LCG003]|uniref:glycosyltransferase n=1 Tax=Aliiglaciecola sp. LCG003 TaxID=3053655 RepID=UPI0025743D75|nr:glycosyltransferase [Aliiglaciecola sp. LCG003]WJG07924.1 glycosyltransferase [Aliiglaciecola sp. LCG003]
MPYTLPPAQQKLLVIGYVWPEPNSSAAGQHMLSLLQQFLQAGYQITFASPALQGEHKVDLTLFDISEVSIALNDSSFDTFVQDLDPQVVLFDRFMMEEQFGWRVAKCCPQALRILDTEDLHFLRDARLQAFKQGIAVDELSLSSLNMTGDKAIREISAIYRCDLSLIISSVEYALLTDVFNIPTALLQICPFMLDPHKLNRNGLGFAQRHDFITIGNFRHAPNWDAVLNLKQNIWPKIRQRLPQANLYIYGAYPPPKATALHNPKQGFFVQGWVDDAKDVMANSRVCLAPLRFGAGLKGKLTEAMMCGTPSVTTAVGAEGIVSTDQWPGSVASSEQDFVDNAVSLYQDQGRWAQAQQMGFVIISKHFDQGQIGATLIASIERLLSNLKQHRVANFTGAMLQHHMHKSTQYMSQWIEAKNAHKKTS